MSFSGVDDRGLACTKLLNLIREFEMQRMKKFEIIKEFSNKLLGIANKIKLLNKKFLVS